jgi:hypothetical protein
VCRTPCSEACAGIPACTWLYQKRILCVSSHNRPERGQAGSSMV